jgi:hypothetical protein
MHKAHLLWPLAERDTPVPEWLGQFMGEVESAANQIRGSFRDAETQSAFAELVNAGFQCYDMLKTQWQGDAHQTLIAERLQSEQEAADSRVVRAELAARRGMLGNCSAKARRPWTAAPDSLRKFLAVRAFVCPSCGT